MPPDDGRIPLGVLLYLGFLSLISLNTTLVGYLDPGLLFGTQGAGGAVADFYATRNLAVLVLCLAALLGRHAGLVFAAILVRLVIETADLGFTLWHGLVDLPWWGTTLAWLAVFTAPQLWCLWAMRRAGSGRVLSIQEQVEIGKPPDEVWRTLERHEAMTDWVRLGLREVSLFADGAAQAGEAGSLRQIRFFGWPPVMERFTEVDAPYRYSYRVIRGMPHLRDHLGTVSVEPTDDGTRVTWSITFVFYAFHPLSFAAPAFVAGFRQVVRGGLANLRGLLERG